MSSHRDNDWSQGFAVHFMEVSEMVFHHQLANTDTNSSYCKFQATPFFETCYLAVKSEQKIQMLRYNSFSEIFGRTTTPQQQILIHMQFLPKIVEQRILKLHSNFFWHDVRPRRHDATLVQLIALRAMRQKNNIFVRFLCDFSIIALCNSRPTCRMKNMRLP